MIMQNNEKFYNYLIFFSIFVVCLFFTISHTLEQNSLDASLIFGGFVESPKGKSQMSHLNSQFSLLIYLGTYLLKFGLSINLISKILIFFSTISYFTGIYLIIISIIKYINVYNKRLISFSFTFIAIFIIELNFGDVDYPAMIFTEHTFGIYSLALPTLIFGLLSNGNIFLAFFFAFILLLTHGVLGIWTLSILILNSLIYIFYHKKTYFVKNAFLGCILGLALFLLVLTFHINSSGQFKVFVFSEYDSNDLINWDILWETHRTIREIDFLYLSKSIILMLIIIFFIKFNKKYIDENTSFALSGIILSIFLGSILYIFYKLFLEFLPPFIKAPMPTRVFNMHTYLSWPIIFSISIFILKIISKKIKINFKKTFFYTSILIFIFIISFNQKNLTNYLFAHYDKNIGIKSILENNPFRTRIAIFIWESPFRKIFFNKEKIKEINMKRYPNSNFWQKIREYKTNSYWLTIHPYQYKLLRYGRKPILIDTHSFDFAYYELSSLNFIKEVIENIFNLPFDKITIPSFEKNSGRVPNNIIKIEFENKNYDNWLKISNKFNLNFIIVPSNWKIDLPIQLSNGNLSLYKIQ